MNSAKATTSHVTIAVQGYRNPEMLRLCLEAVEEHAQGYACQIIVADSATEEDTALMMQEEFPDITFLPHKNNIGFGAMVNACIEVAQGKYLFIINPDTILEKETVSQLFTYMENHPDVGLCGPAQKNFNGKVENTRFRFYRPQTILYRRTFLKRFAFAQKHLRHFEMRDIVSQEPYAVPWVMGSAMFVRTEALDRVGGMDRRFFMYMEDVDWCRRFWEKGFKVMYYPGVTLFHFYGKGSAKHNAFFGLTNRLTWVHIASGFKYFAKYAGTSVPVVKD